MAHVHVYESRILELANRLKDMTVVEWETLKCVIDKKIECKKKELDRQLQLSNVKHDDFLSGLFSSNLIDDD